MTRRGLTACLLVLVGGLGAARIQDAPARQPLDATGSTAPAPKTLVPREGCVTAECHPGIKSRPVLHGPVRVNGCDGCHKVVDGAKHTFEPLRGRHDLCSLCHAPEPSTSPVVHEPFAQGECLACHDPHGSTETRLLRGSRYADSCLKCHADVTGAHDNVHGPASVGACGACHQPHAARLPKLLNAEGRDLCLRCHVRTGLEISSAPVPHQPALGDCQVCHDPHATDQKAMLVADPATLCTQCHADIKHTMETATTQHAAVTTKRACLNCHNPHGSRNPSLLRQDVKSLCFECHNQPIKAADGTTIVNMKQVIETGTSLHGAVTQRGCVECHEIHGGGHRKLLTNEYPSDLYFPFSESSYALCFSCHDRQLVLLADTGSATGFRNGTENLHYVHVNKDKKGRSCKVCHDAHAANHEKHIRDEVVYGAGGWKLPIKYEALPEGGRCGAGCHQPLEYNRREPIKYPQAPESKWKGEDMVPGVLADPKESGAPGAGAPKK
ncbi:MAG: cytochrome c3 family protein [Phycisphaerales bacterium]